MLGKRVLFMVGLSLFFYGCQEEQNTEISYNKDIRPILNKNCLSCHGGVKKLGGYSLLFPEEAYDTTATGVYGIVPGKPEQSELYLRLVHQDPTMRMPYEMPPLQKKEIQLIKQWIKEGAKWEDHWAFIPPDQSIQPPQVPENDWSDHPVDQFVWRKLAQHNLAPAPQANKATLVRRLYLDLIGLAPTFEEAQAFIQNDDPQAYENLVDQLLASPHFGEHWASMWLDLARYGDSQGYQKDRIRKHIWRYRDWVIDAFNRDLPFNEFTIEQLAGDLLENGTENQLLATAFHRNTNTNDEGGTDDEEFRIVAVMDRLNTTYEIWQGITMSCIQCHSHPYDPILQEAFYESMAFFNNTMDADLSSEKPRAALLSPGQVKLKAKIETHLEELRSSGDTVNETFQSLMEEFVAIQPGPVPVMLENAPEESRQTPIFIRGNWLNHGPIIQPDVPEPLNDWPSGAPKNRLGFAQWLTAPENPLTGRVIVNRFWAQIFGRGIVETLEDFGTQGANPSHPELLDWLALQFIHEHHWSVKSLLKQIVMSSTYQQQSAIADPALLEIDPYNQWLARGPRFRLSAEQIRDQALTVSGLLSRKMYGPSVMPPQPEGVWNIIRHVAKWETSPGEDKYRRAVYTFIRKTSPYPARLTFDGTSRETCVSRRIRTNTPLQAMITLNDPVYLEVAMVLAKQMYEAHPESIEDQIKYGYQRLLFDQIETEKLTHLVDFFRETKAAYEANPAEVEALMTDSTLPQTADFAALVNVTNVLLNLDEFLNKS